MKTSTFQLVIHSLRFLVVLLLGDVIFFTTGLVLSHLDVSFPVVAVVFLLVAGAYWLLAEKIMSGEPRL